MIRLLSFKALTFVFVTATLAAQPEIEVRSAAELGFPTEAGAFYQLETAKAGTDSWEPVGPPIEGTGEKVFRLIDGKLATSGNTFRLTPLSNQWVLVWDDEFDGDQLDMSKWGKEENGYGGGNNERQFYSTDPKYCYVKDGNLHLAVYRDPHTTSDGKTQPYSSARIRTLDRGDWRYGKFEIRAKVPGGEGIWPAVWMLPSHSPYGTWAASGEIDILESRGSNVHETLGTIHFGGQWPKNQHKGTAYTFPDQDASEAFHTYAVEWEEGEIRWYVNGQLYQTLTKDDWNSESAPDNPLAPFNQPFHLILNVAVDGGFFAGTNQNSQNLPDSAFPQVLEVDYVRVYQWAE